MSLTYCNEISIDLLIVFWLRLQTKLSRWSFKMILQDNYPSEEASALFQTLPPVTFGPTAKRKLDTILLLNATCKTKM